jgi:hypothetical protein
MGGGGMIGAFSGIDQLAMMQNMMGNNYGGMGGGMGGYGQ